MVIDVGTNAVEDKTKKSGIRWVGDVDFESAKDVVSMITPVPGGVGYSRLNPQSHDGRNADEEHSLISPKIQQRVCSPNDIPKTTTLETSTK